MAKLPQKEIDSDEVEYLVRQMVEAYHFLTVEIQKPARYANAERIDDAKSVLGMTLGAYQDAIEVFQEKDRIADRQFAAEMNLRHKVN